MSARTPSMSTMAQYPTYNPASCHSPAFRNFSFAALNISSTTAYPTPAITTHASQFDSPTFNNGTYQQLSRHPLPYHMPVTPHSQPMHLLPAPHFQIDQHHRPYLYPSQPEPYQSLPSFVPSQASSTTLHHTSQLYRHNTDITLESSPLIVPSQHRDTLHSTTSQG